LNKKILIVGGTGFIGFNLALGALKKGFKVTSLSSKKPNKYRFNKKIRYLIGDIRKKINLFKILEINNFDYVINASGYVNHIKKIDNYKTHYLGSKNLVDFFKKKKIKHFINIGSSMEYGKSKSPQKENSKCNPLSYYGKSHYLASSYVLSTHKKTNFPGTVVRLYQVYGPYQNTDRLIPYIIKNCLDKKEFNCSKGNQTRSFIFINDLVKIIFYLLNNKLSCGKIVNISNKKKIKVIKVIKLIRSNFKESYPIFNSVKLRDDEQLKTYPSLKNLLKLLDLKKFKFINLSQGIKKTISHFKKYK